MAMKTEKIESLNGSLGDTNSYKRVIDKAFFDAVVSMDESSFRGVIVNAKLLDRDKSFLGNRLRVSA